MSLSEQKIRQIKPSEKTFYMSDGDGLSLKIDPNGIKSWSYRYTKNINQQRSRLKLGTYPQMSLKQARLQRDLKKQQLFAEHTNTFQEKSLLDIFEEWIDFKQKNIFQDQPRCGVIQLAKICFAQDILPYLGTRNFQQIKRLDLVKVIRQIEQRQVKEPVKKACSYLNQLYNYAVAMGYCDDNIAQGLQKILLTQSPKRNYSYLKQDDIAEFLFRIQYFEAHPITKKALLLKLYTGVRGAEILAAEPHHFDLEKKIWKIPAKNVKQLRRKAILGFDVPDYMIPLSSQAIHLVNEAMQWSVGDKYVFSSPKNKNKNKNKPLHFNTLNTFIRRMGYSAEQLSAHGLRSSFSTILNETGLFESIWIETQLSHCDPNTTRASYNHADYLTQRRHMMQWWGDYLSQLETSQNENS